MKADRPYFESASYHRSESFDEYEARQRQIDIRQTVFLGVVMLVTLAITLLVSLIGA